VIWFLSVLAAGCRVFPIHPQLAMPEVLGAVRQASAVAMIAPAPRHVDAGLVFLPFDGALLATGGSDGCDVLPQLREGGGLILLSSGTTGTPKCVLREPRALDAVADATVRATRLKTGERVIAAIPLFHSYGVDMLLATVLAGASLHIHEQFDPVSISRGFSSGAPAILPGVPFMFEALSRVKPAPGVGASSLRLAISAGAPLPARVDDAMALSWGVRVGQLYGATELGSVTLNDPGNPMFAPSSVGLPMEGVSIRVLDPDNLNRELPPDREGHIAVAAPSMLSGYVPEGALDLVDGHLPMGDLGRVDNRGRLFITGRTKLLIESAGLKISPVEVENVIAQHPGVSECVVGPLPLSSTVVRLRAVFVAADPLRPPSEDDLRRHVRERLAPYKVPRVFERVDALPRSPSGKILRALVFRGSPPP
jgi:long-chain acyl-CoA synthetase